MAQTDAANVPQPLILRDDHRTETGIEPGCFLTDWLNDPGDPDLSIARIRVAPGAETRLRRFENIQERYVVLDGQGRIELVGPNRAFAEGDHTLSALEPGDVVVIPAGYSRRITNIGEFDLSFWPFARRASGLRRCRMRRRPAPRRPSPVPESGLRTGNESIHNACSGSNIAGFPLPPVL